MPDILPPRKLIGRIDQVLSTVNRGRLGFQSKPVASLAMDLEGIVDNRHRGWTRGADGRVPYLPRGTTIRNDRHVSLVSIEDVAVMAERLEIERLDPAWIGANMIVSGLPNFSFLPRGTHLFCEGGAILTVTDQNAPCTLSGAALAARIADRADLKLKFPALAKGLRGLVATVEHPGTLTAPTRLEARLPAQWLYQ